MTSQEEPRPKVKIRAVIKSLEARVHPIKTRSIHAFLILV